MPRSLYEPTYESVVAHECGHYIMSRACGHIVDSFSLNGEKSIPRGVEGYVQTRAPSRHRNVYNTSRLVEDRIKILYSGCVSQTMFYGRGEFDENVFFDCRDIWGSSDFASITTLSACLSLEISSCASRLDVERKIKLKLSHLLGDVKAILKRNYHFMASMVNEIDGTTSLDAVYIYFTDSDLAKLINNIETSITIK